MKLLMISFGMAALTLLVAAVIGFVFFRNSGIECFAATFSNAGFIGIPLVQASIGSEGVFYLSGILLRICLPDRNAEHSFLNRYHAGHHMDCGKAVLRRSDHFAACTYLLYFL